MIFLFAIFKHGFRFKCIVSKHCRVTFVRNRINCLEMKKHCTIIAVCVLQAHNAYRLYSSLHVYKPYMHLISMLLQVHFYPNIELWYSRHIQQYGKLCFNPVESCWFLCIKDMVFQLVIQRYIYLSIHPKLGRPSNKLQNNNMW